MRGLCCLVVAGCRLNFGFDDPDAAVDAQMCPIVHDEDNDSLDDACDPCPHVAGDAADMDGDGVGDACDPQPTLAVQRIAFFDPFTTRLAEWGSLSNFTLEQDQLRAISMSPQTSYTTLAQPTGETRIVVSGTVNAIYATTPHSISIVFGFNNGGTNWHYVQFFDVSGGNGTIDIAKSENSAYSSIVQTTYAGDLPVGAWQMQIDESVAAQHIRLASTLGGSPQMTLDADTSTPTILTASPDMSLMVRNADVVLDYLIVITSQ